MMRNRRFTASSQLATGLLATGLLAGGWLMQACAAGEVEVDFDDGDATTATTSSGMGGATSSTTATGMGGTMTSSSSGMQLPCGIDCSTIQTDDCHKAECNTETKQCEIKNADNGTNCEDGLFCTVNDSCLDGVCTAGPQNDCGVKAGDCDDVVCDEQGMSCSLTPKPNGGPCSNTQDLCLVNTSCQNGLCVGTTKDCFFAPVPNDCHVAQCNPQTGMCDPQPGNENQPCSDLTDLCTVNKTCKMGKCEGGSPKDCSNLTVGCNIGECDKTTGSCKTTPVMQGQMCDDLDYCTVGETCQMGQCTGGTPITVCSGQVEDKCCPMGCVEATDKDCGGTIPGFMGEIGPTFTGWKQCEGYLDKPGGDDVPANWGDDCVSPQFTKVKLVCGASLATYRYIDLNKNVFKDGLSGYPEKGLITASKDQNGTSFTLSNDCYAEGNHPHPKRSWWGGGSGCGETNTNLTINNVCMWEASNCFGQGVSGNRYLWVYVAP